MNPAKLALVVLAVGMLVVALAANSVQASAAPNKDSEKAPTVVVFVHMINDNGGSLGSGAFSVSVNGKNASPSAFTGSETGTPVVVRNGDYKVSESAVFGYNVSYSPGCEGKIHTGMTVTCVITNDDIPISHLLVKTHVVNGNGGTYDASNFAEVVIGNNPQPNAFSGLESGNDVAIGPGSYQVLQLIFYDHYTRTLSADCSGTFTTSEDRTCTVTYTYN